MQAVQKARTAVGWLLPPYAELEDTTSATELEETSSA